MKKLNALWLAAALLCAPGCAGRALDLDRPAPPSSAGAGGSASEVATTQLKSDLADFRVDDTRVYWSTLGGTIGTRGPSYGCVFDDCASTTVTYADSGPDFGYWVVPLADDILFNSSTDIVRCPKTGCVGAPIRVIRDASSFGTFGDVTVDGDYMYWLSSSSIYRCLTAQCADIPEVVATHQLAGDLNIRGSNAYWTTASDPNAWLLSAPNDGSQKPIMIVPQSANESDATVQVPPVPGSPTLDAERAYWLDANSHVQSCSLSGCRPGEPIMISTSDEQKQDLVADATGLYWLETTPSSPATGTIRYCPSSGCPKGTPPMALSSDSTLRFRLSPSYIYWDDAQKRTDSDQQSLFGTVSLIADRIIHRASKPMQLP